MLATIVVEGKVLGQKQPLFTDWHIELPPIWLGRPYRSFKLPRAFLAKLCATWIWWSAWLTPAVWIRKRQHPRLKLGMHL